MWESPNWNHWLHGKKPLDILGKPMLPVVLLPEPVGE